MARRVVDTLFFQAENVVATVYYHDTETGGRRFLEVLFTQANDPTKPAQAPPGEQAPTRRQGVPGQPILPTFCEGTTGVTIRALAGFPYAEIGVNPTHPNCALADVVCDLQATVVVTGLDITLSVTTSYPPWRVSEDGLNFTEGRTLFRGTAGSSGTLTVRDAANCRRFVAYTIADPDNPKPPGSLLDVISYSLFSGPNQPQSRIEVYGLLTAPYTLAAWAPDGAAFPRTLSLEQRGRADEQELPPVCANQTQLRYFASRETPFLRVQITENSPECGYVPPVPPTGDFRFDYVVARPESALGGDGLIQAAVLGNDGPVLFSLDNYRTPGQVSGIFENLRAGDYRVYARENRPLGRTIFRDITVGRPARGLRYQVSWRDPAGACYRANLYRIGYAGPVERLAGTAEPLELRWNGASPGQHFFEHLLLSSEATLSVLLRAGDKADDLILEHERQMRLELVRDGRLLWAGWLLPDLYEEPHLARPYPMTLRATDGLAALKEFPFTDAQGQPLRGEWTHWRILRHILDLLASPLPWVVLHTLYPAVLTVTPENEPLQLVSSDLAGFADSGGKPWSCEKVLQTLLDYHALRLQLREGTWFFERLAELNAEPLTARPYDATGERVPGVPYSLLRVVGRPGSALYWQRARQLLSRQPAVVLVRVEAEPGSVRNFFPSPDFPASLFDPNTKRLLGWKGALIALREPDAADPTKPAGLRLVRRTTLEEVTLDSPGFRVPVAGAGLYASGAEPVGYQPFLCTLSFTAQLAKKTFTPDAGTGPAALYVGLGIGEPEQLGGPTFLIRADGAGGEAQSTKIPVLELAGPSAVKVSIPFAAGGGLLGLTQTALVRFYGTTVDDVLIRDLAVTIGSATNGSFVNESRGLTRASRWLSKRDESLTLQLADTLNVDEKAVSVLQRSVLLAATGGAIGLWREGTDPAEQAYYGIDLLVRDRLSWQQQPCWVLRGLLRGNCSPGALLVDPAFDPDVVFLVTTATWLVAAGTWEVTAVQVLGLRPPRPVSLTGLLSEDGRLLLAENSSYLLLPEAS